MRTLLAVLLLAGRLAAQTPVSFTPFDALAPQLREALKITDPASRGPEIASLLKENVNEFALYAPGRSVFSTLAEENRLDKQVGTSGAAAGSTSLVSKGSTPALIGMAVEGGALYQSVSGNLVTFRLNPSGLARALAKNTYLLSATPVNASLLEKGVSRVSASASFDLSQGSTPGTFTAERSQLREAALRIDIFNKRDPRHRSHAASIRGLNRNMKPFVAAVTAYFAALSKTPGYDAWVLAQSQRLVELNPVNDEELLAAITEVADSFTDTFASDPQLQTLGSELIGSIKSFRGVRDALFKEIARSSVLTFEYAFDRLTVPADALALLPSGTVIPDLSTGRLIYSAPIGSFGEATLNGSATMFNSSLPQMRGRLRDVQVAGSLDFRLPEIQGIGKAVLTFAGMGAFLHQQPFGAKVKLRGVETADGVIKVFQTKLTLPAGSASGVRIPISLTVANRSEFITEKKEVRASIGMTFDLDKLFAH